MISTNYHSSLYRAVAVFNANLGTLNSHVEPLKWPNPYFRTHTGMCVARTVETLHKTKLALFHFMTHTHPTSTLVLRLGVSKEALKEKELWIGLFPFPSVTQRHSHHTLHSLRVLAEDPCVMGPSEAREENVIRRFSAGRKRGGYSRPESSNFQLFHLMAHRN